MKLKVLPLLVFAFALTLPSQAQNIKLSKEAKQVEKEAKKREREAIEDMLKVYTICPAPETEFVISAVERIVKNKNQSLARDTATGLKEVSRTDSYDVLITFQDKMRFADVRPDRSKPEKYENDKKVAIENLQYYINTGKSMLTDKPIEKSYNELTTYSLQRSELIGNTLGISVIFDDANKMITTIYFPNADGNGAGKKFKNIAGWAELNNKFLDSYTKCLQSNLK